MTAALADVEGLTIEYRGPAGTVRPVAGLDLVVGDGELVVLLGASGSGKTSVLSAFAGIVPPTAGRVRVVGVDVGALRGKELTAYRRRTLGVVFQAFNLVPSLQAWENVAVPLQAAGVRGPEARERALAAIGEVGLADRAHHLPAQLSGGQQQRVAIARALVHEPRLVIADEPTAHLDFLQVEGILALLRRVASPGRAVLAATHDERLLERADRVVELSAVGPALEEARGAARHLRDGELLFGPEDRDDLAYAIEVGVVELFVVDPGGVQRVVRRAHRGDHVGELAALTGIGHSLSARAVGETLVRAVTGPELRRRAKQRGS